MTLSRCEALSSSLTPPELNSFKERDISKRYHKGFDSLPRTPHKDCKGGEENQVLYANIWFNNEPGWELSKDRDALPINLFFHYNKKIMIKEGAYHKEQLSTMSVGDSFS